MASCAPLQCLQIGAQRSQQCPTILFAQV